MSDPWDGLLDKDEHVVWQGAPNARLKNEWENAFQPFFFTFFTGFSLFWMIMASFAPGPFWMFGLLFFGVGFYQLVLVHFWKAYLRSKTFYTLTNKRAFIATAVPYRKKTLASYPINGNTVFWLEDGPYTTIHFAKESVKHKKSTTERRIGFEELENGREVYALMRKNVQGES